MIAQMVGSGIWWGSKRKDTWVLCCLKRLCAGSQRQANDEPKMESCSTQIYLSLRIFSSTWRIPFLLADSQLQIPVFVCLISVQQLKAVEKMLFTV